MKSGEIWLIEFQTIARGQPKIRPVLVVATLPGRYQNTLLCGVSTKTSRALDGWDEKVSQQSSDFSESGLRTESAIVLSYVQSVDRNSISARQIGRIGADRLSRIRSKLAEHLAKPVEEQA